MNKKNELWKFSFLWILPVGSWIWHCLLSFNLAWSSNEMWVVFLIFQPVYISTQLIFFAYFPLLFSYLFTLQNCLKLQKVRNTFSSYSIPYIIFHNILLLAIVLYYWLHILWNCVQGKMYYNKIHMVIKINDSIHYWLPKNCFMEEKILLK